ncbi:EamA family transporter [Nocardia blacklockiae]|uniref:EamA family transporter n=1 Tax=Nocardia blacklockiae TaxID=480036 RepID=UPI00189384C4|nr:EamA family transporter [Nocardia blacklockiae]MBF6175957.1 EamA family transporter [Nocardia blacklockiae]
MVPAPLFVLAAALATQTGQAFGKQLFARVDPPGVVALRVGIAALALVVLYRPRRWPRGRRLGTVVALGAAIAGMNLIYPALHYLPLGVAGTLQLLGPLTVALAGSRRPADVAVVALAVTGLVLVRDPASGALAWQGITLALLSAASMGTYLLLSRRVGADADSRAGLALGVAVAALFWVPVGVADSGSDLAAPGVLVAGCAVALLSAVVPYSLELAALQRLPAGVVGTLLTLEPVVAAGTGWLVLHEELSARRWLGIGCICAAAAGVTLATGRRSRDRIGPIQTLVPDRERC